MADDALIFVGIALSFFGQLWGLVLVALGLGIMVLKGEISLGGVNKKDLTEEEKQYFEYTGDDENDEDDGEAGAGAGGDGNGEE